MIKCERCPLEDECKVLKITSPNLSKFASAFASEIFEVNPQDNWDCILWKVFMNQPLVEAKGKET